jgi:hypothetical protein
MGEPTNARWSGSAREALQAIFRGTAWLVVSSGCDSRVFDWPG